MGRDRGRREMGSRVPSGSMPGGSRGEVQERMGGELYSVARCVNLTESNPLPDRTLTPHPLTPWPCVKRKSYKRKLSIPHPLRLSHGLSVHNAVYVSSTKQEELLSPRPQHKQDLCPEDHTDEVASNTAAGGKVPYISPPRRRNSAF